MLANIKPNVPFIVLALITITLSSWGLFRLLVDFAGCPWWFACLAVGGVDLVAVVCGKQAVDLAGDGDSPAFWNLAMLGITGVAAWLQFAHTRLAGQPAAIGVIMAVFPVATVLLFEGRLRRAARLAGRERGTVLGPRAAVPLIVWVRFPRLAWDAFSIGVLNRDLSSSDVLQAAQQGPAEADVPDNLRELPPVPAAVPDIPSAKPSVAVLVRDAKAVHGNDRAAVAKMVRDIYPEVHPETLRKNLNRELTNGHRVASDA